MKKIQPVFYFFIFLASICVTSLLSAQNQLSDLNTYAWKEKTAALALITDLQNVTNAQLSTATSVRPAGANEFSQLLYKKVFDKINSGNSIPVSIEEGFNESVALVDNNLSSSAISMDERQSVLGQLIELLKQD
jgi:hypothetical protein